MRLKGRIPHIVVCLFLLAGPAAFAIGTDCQDEYGNPAPCQQDPGGGGGGGIGPGSCLNAYRGVCRGQESHYYGVECLVKWCEADPASGGACATDTRPECYIGTDRNGEDRYVEVNVCTLCPRGNL